MTATGHGERPVLGSDRVRLRPGAAGDAEALRSILAEPSVVHWWGNPPSVADLETDLAGRGHLLLLVVEADGELAGGIQYEENDDPNYAAAGIDIFLGARHQGKGIGPEAIGLLVQYLFDQRGHHRITIDPAVANKRAIRCYAKVGFRPVGVMRQYERGPDGSFHDGLLMELLRDDCKG